MAQNNNATINILSQPFQFLTAMELAAVTPLYETFDAAACSICDEIISLSKPHVMIYQSTRSYDSQSDFSDFIYTERKSWVNCVSTPISNSDRLAQKYCDDHDNFFDGDDDHLSAKTFSQDDCLNSFGRSKLFAPQSKRAHYNFQTGLALAVKELRHAKALANSDSGACGNHAP